MLLLKYREIKILIAIWFKIIYMTVSYTQYSDTSSLNCAHQYINHIHSYHWRTMSKPCHLSDLKKNNNNPGNKSKLAHNTMPLSCLQCMKSALISFRTVGLSSNLQR